MAFMSEVTHGKLVGKYTATPDGIGGEHMTYTADTERSSVIGEGIVGCGSFNAQVRCCAPFGSASSIRQATCWTGESDGSLTIRQAWSGEVVNNVERKAGVFVTCLKHSGNMMYAGMSDGYLRAFESSPSGDDYTLMSEARKHTGDILCIETVGSNIFTGARDWQVFVWRWDDEVLRAVDQFAGHQLAVRCLAYADGYLYSGGDEGVIRCIHMETGKEIMTCESAVPGFPIGQNKGGIKSLCVVDNVFFSGDEENINVWEAKTGNHLRLLLKSEGAVLTLMKDPCGNRVWSGGVDGVIRLWSAVDFTLLCSLNDHNGSFVRGLVPLTRVSSTKAWTINKDGELQLWYTESDCSEFVETTSREERRLTTTIMNLRESIVNNYAKLEGHKQDLKKSESLEASRKKALAEAFFRSGNVCLNRKYFGKLMSMLQARKRQKKSAILCNALHTSTGQERRAVYYGKLAKFAKQRADYKKNQKFAECILSNTEKTLQIVYYRKLKEYTRRATLKHKKEALAASLQRNTTGGLQRSTLFKWMRWDQKRRHTKKRRTISHAMFRHTKNGLLFIYYAKLVAYYKREREEVRKGTLTDTLLRTLYRSMRHAYYMKWLKWFKRKSDAGRRKRVAHILMRTTCHGTLRLYWSKWMEWRLSGMHRALESKYDEMQKNVKKLELKLKAAKFVTEEDLRKQVSDLDNEAAKLEKELEMLEGKADSLEDECQKLDMEANGFLHHDPSQPIQEQLVHVCAYLKARGVSCRHDIRTISDTTGKKERGVPVFTNGLSRLKKALVQAGCTKSSHHWGCTSDRIKQLERKYLQESHKGIKEIIIGVDQMRYYKSTFPVDLCQEVLDNIHVLYEVVTRIYGDRMAHDMNDLRVAQKMRENDPYATQHGKLINDKKSNTFLERQARSKEGSLREKVRSKESNPPVPRRSGTPTPRAGSTEPSEPATARSLISPPMSSRSARPSPGFKVGDNLRVIAITSDRAKHSGLQTGDVITAVNNVVVSDKTQYVGRVKMTVPGDVVTISFTRNGVKAKTIRMAMGEMERSVAGGTEQKMLRGFLATVLLVTEVLGAANVGATNKCFFAFRSSEGLHTVPVHGGPVKKLTGTTEITFTSGLAVDGFRGIVLWNEENKIFKINTDGTGKVLLLNAELQKGARMLPKLVHGLTLKTEDHLAFGSIHDDKGGFRVFAFDYLSSNPVMEWSWCHTSTCAVRSTLPVGGSLAAVGDKVFISSGALSQRAHGMGGCSMRWWDSTTSDMLESVIQRNREKDEGMFSGEMGGLVVDEAQSKLYFTESTPSNTNIWVSDLEGTYTSKVLTWLPPHRSWSRRVQGVPSSSIACIGSGTLAVANGTHILKVDLSTPDTFTHVLYSAPSEEEEHVSPIAHYCEGFHTGGRFPTPPPVHDEL